MKYFSFLVLTIAMIPLIALAGTSTAPVDATGSSVSITGTPAVTQSGTWTVQPGNTANTTAWKVDGSAVTQPVSGPLTDTQIRATPLPVSGTVTAKLNDGAGTSVTVGQKAMSASLPVVLASDQAAIPVTSTAQFSTRSDTFTTASNGTTVDAHLAPLKSFSLAVKATGSVTSWTVVLECSLDNTNFTTVLTHTNVSPGDGQIMAAGTNLFPCMYFRTRTSAITLGAGTNVIATILAM